MSIVSGAVVLLGACAFTLQGQRLPASAKPEHYTLVLTPDLKAATFTGSETIDVTLVKPSAEITLNAAEIKFESVTVEVNGKTLAAKATTDEEKQQATFHFDQTLPAGKLKLAIRYTGILNNELRGFYLSKTARRNYAVTQFESTDARRAFPSFDEPALKATFSITLVVDKSDVAISNTNIVKDEPIEGDKHAVSFAETPRMSTYLLAFLVGDFQCLSGSSDGVPIRVCATPDQVKYGAFALSTAEYALHYYNQYFGIKYPMPKLDMVALPDFEAGAMENFGAITYRETDLLLDDHASVGAQKRVALVVTHEMAHQWFGDMVTMQWWDNVWLNEGFASWMENKPIEAWKPEWKFTQSVAADNQGTLNLDAQHTTRTIRAKAETPSEINEMFDGISYGKAGAVLLMVENYVGEETFRQGVHNYLAAHLYGNATAEDFWTAQTATSHKPVDKIMDSLVSQPGVPVLTLGAPAAGKVAAQQQRFFLNPKNTSGKAESWVLPVCFKAATDTCDVLSKPKQSLTAPSAPLLFANASGKGYYRTIYPESAYKELVAKAETALGPEERISLVGDTWAISRAGKIPVGQYLDLVAAVHDDANSEVVGSTIGSLNTIVGQIASSAGEQTKFRAWVRKQFTEPYHRLGKPAPDDSPEKLELRAELLNLVAGLGQDPDAIAEARSIAAQGLSDRASVDATLYKIALNIAAANGDEALFTQLQTLSTEAPNPQQRAEALRALALFRDPALTTRALDFFVSGKVRNQDAAGMVATELRSRFTQDLAWEYVQKNWDKVAAQLTTFGGAYIVGATGSFCSADRIEQVQGFFATHKVIAAERTLSIAKDEINDCIDLRQSQESNLKAWLAKQ